MKVKYDELVKSITDTRAVADQKTIQAKMDDAETIKRNIEYKQQDGQRVLDSVVKELTDLFTRTSAIALQAYASTRGLT